jgi:hypothetical protein
VITTTDPSLVPTGEIAEVMQLAVAGGSVLAKAAA